MQYAFMCHGHENIRATHPTTIEFTKDSALTRRGDCIAGVAATFDPEMLSRFLNKTKVAILLEAGNEREELCVMPNPEFCDGHEMVIRKGSFASNRTFGTLSTKGAKDINRKLVGLLRDPAAVLKVTLHD